MHNRDNIEYRDILTHDNRHQLFLISPIPSIIVNTNRRTKNGQVSAVNTVTLI